MLGSAQQLGAAERRSPANNLCMAKRGKLLTAAIDARELVALIAVGFAIILLATTPWELLFLAPVAFAVASRHTQLVDLTRGRLQSTADREAEQARRATFENRWSNAIRTISKRNEQAQPLPEPQFAGAPTPRVAPERPGALRWAENPQWDYRAGKTVARLTAEQGALASVLAASAEELCSAMRLKRGQLSIEVDPERTYHCTVIVRDKPAKDHTKVANTWKPPQHGETWGLGNVPFGLDRNGKQVGASLTGASGGSGHALIGGISGGGKSCVLATLLASLGVVAGNETLTVIVCDPKRDPDLAAWAPWSSRFCSDPEEIAKVLEAVVAEQARRFDTGEGARAGRVVVFVDEVAQIATDPAVGERVSASLDAIAARGRQAGIAMVLATQSPRNTDIPNRVRDNLEMRLCLKTKSLEQARALLGSALKLTELPLDTSKIRDPGLGVVDDAAGVDGPIAVRVSWCPDHIAERVRARTARNVQRPEWVFPGAEGDFVEGEVLEDDWDDGGLQDPEPRSTPTGARNQGSWDPKTPQDPSPRPLQDPPKTRPRPSQDPQLTFEESCRELLALRGDGVSWQKIADSLNEQGFPTRSGKGAWSKGTVSNVHKELNA